MHEISSIFDSLGKGWDEIASHYDDEQMALLLEFLKRSNAISREEIFRLREGSGSEKGIYSTPLGDLESGRLIVSSGLSKLTVRAGERMTELYQARFEGPVPDVKVKDGVVSIRYPRRMWMLGSEQRAAEITLSTAIPWRIEIQGGAGEITAKLGGLRLAGLEVKGGMSMIRLELPVPSDVVPIRIRGSASVINVRRPTGVAARVHLKGWASTFNFDDQHFSDVGNDVRLQSPGYNVSGSGYDIEVSSSVSTVSITAE
jgi:membrane-associated protease RseP (regulator of RpoE activity)